MATTFGKYTLKEELGRGGMGAVYRAHDAQLRRDVALKVMPKEHCRDPVTVERFVREARALAHLQHPNLTAIYDVGEENGRYFFAMELVDGLPLSDVIHQRGRLPWEETVQTAVQMLAGLAEAHEAGLIHRDLKPGNVMLNEDGRAILMDFGLAKREGEGSLTEDGIILGTPDYMSPEHAQGQALDSRTDLYSMGVVLFHMLSGRVPYVGKSSIKVLEKHVHEPVPALNEIVHDLPEGLSDVVATLMAKKPEERFQTAGEVTSALQGFVTASSGIKAGLGVPDSEEDTYVEETQIATQSASVPNPGRTIGGDEPDAPHTEPRTNSVDSAATMTSKVDSDQPADRSRTQLMIVFVGGAAACALCLLLISGISRLVGKKPRPVPVVNDTSTTIDATTTSATTTTVPPAPSSKVRIEFIDGRTLEGELVKIDKGGNVSVKIGTAGESQPVQLKMERIRNMVPQD